MSFMSCSIIVARHENRDPSSIASGEHSPNRKYNLLTMKHWKGMWEALGLDGSWVWRIRRRVPRASFREESCRSLWCWREKGGRKDGRRHPWCSQDPSSPAPWHFRVWNNKNHWITWYQIFCNSLHGSWPSRNMAEKVTKNSNFKFPITSCLLFPGIRGDSLPKFPDDLVNKWNDKYLNVNYLWSPMIMHTHNNWQLNIISWLIGWNKNTVIGSLVVWYSMIGKLIISQSHWLADWLVNNHNDWLTNYFTITVIGWLVVWQSQWLANWLFDIWQPQWLADW